MEKKANEYKIIESEINEISTHKITTIRALRSYAKRNGLIFELSDSRYEIAIRNYRNKTLVRATLCG